MNWKYALKRALGNRYAMTAVLFLLITLWGSATVLFGTLDMRSACGGFAPPKTKTLAKHDPTAPHRSATAAATADLTAWEVETASWSKQANAATASAENTVTRALENDHTLIQVFGAYQALSGRTVVEDPASPQYAVVKLPDSSLTFVAQGDPDPAAQASELARLRSALAERDVSLLYCQAPSKLEPGEQTLPYGMEDTSNACVDALLAALDGQGVDYLDFRETLRREGGEWRHWFYATDHHWTQEAAFLAFRDLCAKLADYDQSIPVSKGTKRKAISIPERFTDPDSFSSTTLSGFFLGSQGKRVGSLYAGADDFILHTPDYPTLLHYSAGGDGQRYGDVQDTVLFPQRVEKRDWFNATPYTYYAGGDYSFAQSTNYYNPDGPRVLLIRDSFACAVTPYLALCTSQLSTVDPRYFSGNLLSLVDQTRPDVVVLLYSTGMARSEDYFRLLPQPAAPSKSDALRWKTDQPQREHTR